MVIVMFAADRVTFVLRDLLVSSVIESMLQWSGRDAIPCVRLLGKGKVERLKSWNAAYIIRG